MLMNADVHVCRLLVTGKTMSHRGAGLDGTQRTAAGARAEHVDRCPQPHPQPWVAVLCCWSG